MPTLIRRVTQRWAYDPCARYALCRSGRRVSPRPARALRTSNGSAAALGLYITFKVYDYGTRKGILFLRILPFIIFAIIGAVIPYLNDAEHLTKNAMEHTLPVYLLANDLYVFLTGLITYKVARSIRAKLILVIVLATIFACLHFLAYAPMFPGFYWL